MPFRSSLLIVMLTLACGLGACTKQETGVHLNVQVRTNQGEPVSGAMVLVDGKALGETSNLGTLQAEVKLTRGAQARLEVKKDSDTYYFAPYHENFKVSESAAQDVMIGATLYFVPKPSPGEETPSKPAEVVEKAVVGPAKPLEAVVDAAQAAAAAALTPPTTSVAPTTSAAPDALAKDSEAAKTDDLVETLAQADGIDETPAADESAKVEAEADPADASETVEAAVSPEKMTVPAPAAASVPAPDAALPATPIALNSVATEAPADNAKPAIYPKRDRQNVGATVFTVHAFTGGNPVEGVDILLGQDEHGDLKLACSTNQRGRCVVRFPVKPSQAVTFVATKKGFRTLSRTVSVSDKTMLRFDLERGQTIDIFAITKTYNYTIGLKDVEVFVAGKRVGQTDRFGRYSHIYEGKTDDLLAISLKPRGFLPETYETDFVASGPMTLVRYFTPEAPPPVKLTILDVKPAGKTDAKTLAAFDTKLDDAVRSAARKHVFSSAAFHEYALTLFNRDTLRAGKTTTDALKNGWQETEMKASVDAVLLPTIVFGDKKTLELAVIDSKAHVLAAAQEELDDAADGSSVDRAVAQIAKKLARAFPFEGAVLSKEADKVTINIGYGAGRGIKVGDVLEVFGVQSAKLGLAQTHKKIAQLTVREVSDETSKCSVTLLAPRATVERGDLVALRTRKAPEAGGAQIRVSANVKGIGSDALPQANVYFNDQWIGATDEAGRLYVDLTGSGTLKVIKQGYQDFKKTVAIAKDGRVDVDLRRETAFLRIDSKPALATISIDGHVIGKTPLAAPVPVPTGFLKLELTLDGNGAGYKPYSQVLELDQGTLDLTGPNTVLLEQDLKARADRLLKAGKVQEGLSRLLEIPKEHSDFLLARHEAGEIYLTQLDEPAKAAAAFGEVTANEAVKEFSDKRFIGSHIDEGIALFLTAEKLGQEHKEESVAHYQKAIEVFDRVIPQLRFVATDQYAQAVHNVDFHRALARHRLWMFSQDPSTLADAVRSWRSYLDGSARSVKAEGPSKVYVENAEVYYKQAIASMASPKAVSHQ